MSGSENNAPFLEVRGLTKTFPGGVTALSGVSFTAGRGDCIVIGGANGSGKSLLMSLIAALSFPTEGQIFFGGKTVTEKSVCGKIGLVFQDADAQILGETPGEDAAFGPRNLGLPAGECARRAAECLEKTGLASKADAPARFLSGGEKRRLAVAGILAMDTELVIFDEPFANLDWPGVLQVNAVIKMLKTEGKTLIILTHEIEKVLALANRFIILYSGKIVFDGTPADGLSQDLEKWGIRNPLRSYTRHEDLIWTE